MLVKDKSHDIAILRTMGATRGAVMRIFLITGASIGVVGTLAGFLLGLLVAENVETIRQFLNQMLHANLFPAELYFLSRLPSVVDPRDVATVVDHDSWPIDPGDDLSVLAGSQARSRRSPALRVT